MTCGSGSVVAKAKEKNYPKYHVSRPVTNLPNALIQKKISGIFLGLYTSLGLSSNSPPWIKQAKLTSTPNQTTSLERFLPAARTGLIYPCLGPVPMIITSPRNSDRFFFLCPQMGLQVICAGFGQLFFMLANCPTRLVVLMDFSCNFCFFSVLFLWSATLLESYSILDFIIGR